MKARSHRTVKVLLELEYDEAVWLKSRVQNHQGSPEEESKEDYQMRQLFWETIKSALKEDQPNQDSLWRLR